MSRRLMGLSLADERIGDDGFWPGHIEPSLPHRLLHTPFHSQFLLPQCLGRINPSSYQQHPPPFTI